MVKTSKHSNIFFLAWLFTIRGFNIKKPQRAAHLFAFMAYTLSSFLALTVIGGTKMFFARARRPGLELQDLTRKFQEDYIQRNGYEAYASLYSSPYTPLLSFLENYLDLATAACAISLLPILALGVAATRMGMAGRSERTSLLLQLGYSKSKVNQILLLETAIISSIGYFLGTLCYLLSLPLWGYVKFHTVYIKSSEMLLTFPYWVIGWSIILLLSHFGAIIGIYFNLDSLRLRHQPKYWWLPLGIGILLITFLPGFIGILLAKASNHSHYYFSFILSIGVFSFLAIIVYLIGPVWILFWSHIWKKLPDKFSFIASRRLRQNYAQHWRCISPMVIALLIFLTFLAQKNIGHLWEVSLQNQILLEDSFTGSIIVLVITLLTATMTIILNLANQIFATKSQIKTLHQLGFSNRQQLITQLLEYLVPIVISTIFLFFASGALFSLTIRPKSLLDFPSFLSQSLIVLIAIYLILTLANLCVSPLTRRLTATYQFKE